jgi:CBS domain-containing protein
MTYWNLPWTKAGLQRFASLAVPRRNRALRVARLPEEGHPQKIQSPKKSDEVGIGNANWRQEEGEMTIARIIAMKGREVLTAQPHRTLKEVAEILAARGIGAVVIADAQGNLLGILSERDIVRAIGRRGAKALEDAASMHMTNEVVTITEDETLLATVEKMNSGRFRHVPILKEGRLAGIISIGDVVKSRLQEMEQESAALRDYIRTA